MDFLLRQLLKNSGRNNQDLCIVNLFSDPGYWTPTLVFWLLPFEALLFGN
jgi:hypothetical protein